ncbi:MAG: lipoyl(octanoyl) transferase LipB [Candidatus Zixiibacteriota bacterium]
MNLGQRPYRAAHEWQKRMVRYRLNGMIRDTIFYTTHPDVITVGRDFKNSNPLNIGEVEVHQISRGGGITYHGPGQLVIYPIFDLRRRGRDLREFIHNIEEGIIRTFGDFGLKCGRNEDHMGVWVKDHKIASIGIAVQQWISFHGAAVNLTTNLKKFYMIDPCGLTPETMTNAEKEINQKITLDDFASNLSEHYSRIFDTKFDDIDMDELAEIIDLEDSSQSL